MLLYGRGRLLLFGLCLPRQIKGDLWLLLRWLRRLRGLLGLHGLRLRWP